MSKRNEMIPSRLRSEPRSGALRADTEGKGSAVKKKFERKSHGRIFVHREEHVSTVWEVLHEIEAEEIGYAPKDLVAVWRGDPNDIVYTRKFEGDVDAITTACWDRGAPVLCVTGQRDPLDGF